LLTAEQVAGCEGMRLLRRNSLEWWK